MYQGYLAAGGKEYQKALDACVSIELVHAFLLIHDDIMDRDSQRHGKKTIHARYEQLARRYFPERDAEHFGISMALTVGDMVAALGSQRIFTAEFDPAVIVRALRKLQSIVSYTVVGQTKDLVMEYRGKASVRDVLQMYEQKTARYTIEGPLHLGVILAGGSDELCHALSRYALPTGRAFQIQDDILGIYGDKKKIGKPLGSDLEEGKMTILVVRAFEQASPQEKRFLLSILGKEGLRPHDLRRVQKLFQRTGAYEYAKNLLRQELTTARQVLKEIPLLRRKTSLFLEGLLDYMEKRDT